MTVTRAQIVASAREWIGTPWHHQERVKGEGCDCAGVVLGVAWEHELTAFDFRAYDRVPDGHTLQALCDTHMARIALDDAQPGDVALIRFAAYPQHLAVFGDYPHGGLSLIHALNRSAAKDSRVVEHRLDTVWRMRIVQAYRLPGVI